MDNISPTVTPVSRVPLYTPFQVRIASFIGGPFAAVYTLHRNFKRIGKGREARLTLCWGVGLIVVMVAALPFLPNKFPNMVIPLAYSIGAGSLAASKQLSKEAILGSQAYIRCTGWNVAAVCVISLVSFLSLIMPLYLAAEYFGLINAA